MPVAVAVAVVLLVVATFFGTLSPTEDFAGEDCLLLFLLVLFRRLLLLVVLDGEGVDAVFVVAAAAEAPVVSFGGDDFNVASSDFGCVVLNCSKLRDVCSVFFVAAVSLSWSLFLLLLPPVAFCCC